MSLITETLRLERNNNGVLKIFIMETIFVSIIIFFLKFVMVTLGQSPHGINYHEIVRIYWMSSPVVCIYLLLRLMKLRAFFSLFLVMMISSVIALISQTKLSLTGEPLSYTDIVAGSNVSLAFKYFELKDYLILLGAILSGVLFFILDKKLDFFKTNRVVIVVLLVFTMPMALSPYFVAYRFLPGWVIERISRLNNEYEMNYFSWDWSGNVQWHGLPIHLVQTSVRRSVSKLDMEQKKEYLGFSRSILQSVPKNKTIIFILCESCWYDENNFKDLYQPLLQNGFTELRATSPHYGAGTANVEFEMLTGLPSNTPHLSGIVYQEYVDSFKDNAESFAAALKRKNYYAFAAHDNSRAFWRRGDVYKKFGFDNFIDLSQMGTLPADLARNKKPWQWQADDYLLYRAALNALYEKQGKPIFMNLITMSTHGPFPHLNDSGETVYKYEVAESLSRLLDFSRQVAEIDKDAVIVVYGDHKPALNKYFYNNNVMPKSLYSTIGDKDEDFTFKYNMTPLDYGDVPVLIKSSDKQAVTQFIKNANQKPYFCVASLVDKYFINSGMLSVNYTQQHGCQDPIYSDYNGYVNLVDKVPSWLYSVSLFENVTE